MFSFRLLFDILNTYMMCFVFYHLGITKKTEVIHDELNPVWNEVRKRVYTRPFLRHKLATIIVF